MNDPTLREDYLRRLAEPSDIKDELPLLLEYATRYPLVRVLELGVRSGRSTSAFLAAAAQVAGHVWSIDMRPPDVPDRWSQSRYWTFKQANDLDVTPDLEGWPASYHVLFIDTSHTLEHTLAELRRFVPYVLPGGIVLCHDTRLDDADLNGGQEPRVRQALDIFCAEYHLAGQVMPWSNGRVIHPRRQQWAERGGRYGLGVMDAPNGVPL